MSPNLKQQNLVRKNAKQQQPNLTAHVCGQHHVEPLPGNLQTQIRGHRVGRSVPQCHTALVLLSDRARRAQEQALGQRHDVDLVRHCDGRLLARLTAALKAGLHIVVSFVSLLRQKERQLRHTLARLPRHSTLCYRNVRTFHTLPADKETFRRLAHQQHIVRQPIHDCKQIQLAAQSDDGRHVVWAREKRGPTAQCSSLTSSRGRRPRHRPKERCVGTAYRSRVSKLARLECDGFCGHSLQQLDGRPHPTADARTFTRNHGHPHRANL